MADLIPVDHDPFAGATGGDGAAAVGRGLVNGVPVIGPYLLGGLNRAAAGIRALKNDTRFSDELAAVERFGEQTAAENPVASTAGEIAGGVVGTLPLVAAAPAAFGAGGGSLAARSAASLASGAALGGADAAVRSDGDRGAIQDGALLGGVIGGASPLVGKLVGKVVGTRAANGNGEAVVREALDGVSEADLASAQHLMQQARGLPGGGVELTLDEALNQVTSGQATRLSQLNRVVTNSGGEGGRVMGEFYARRPASVENAGRAAFDRVAPENYSPSGIGMDVQAAAEAGLAQTPEGQALAQARAAAGPRVTPLQAGETIQPEVRRVADRIEQQRERQAAVDYGAAREAPERVGIERTVTVERPGEPIVTRYDGPPRFEPDAPQPVTPFQAAAAETGQPTAESLARYIARMGGIAPTDDLLAAGLHQFAIPGVGKVVREGGKPLDGYWRQQLRDAGYFRPDADGYATSDIANELIRSLQNEQRAGSRFGKYPDGMGPGSRRVAVSGARDEYDAALSIAESRMAGDLRAVGIDPEQLHPDVRSRVLGQMMRGEAESGSDALEAVVARQREAPPPTVTPTTVTEEVSAPRFGQVNPQAALDTIDGLLRSAKGNVAQALEATRRDLFERGIDPVSGARETDLSITGLHQARERLDRRIAEAIEAGDGVMASRLQPVREALDGALKSAPEMATADANFALNSRPLEPFQGNTPLGRVARRDDLTGRMAMPPEQVPGTLSTPSAAREFADVATPGAREALEGRVTTQILDGVTDARGRVDANALRTAMRESEDLLATFPAARERLADVVAAREGMARVEASPLGRLALQTPDGRKAVSVLFPANPLPNSEREISDAVSALARNNPRSARDLVRLYLESTFNEATQALRSGPAQYGGAGFAASVRGNPQQRHNLEAAVRALPEGETVWAGLDKLLTTLEATGFKPTKGSDTYFNSVIGERLRAGNGPVGQAIAEVATGAAAGAGVGGISGAAGGAVLGARRAARDLMTRANMLGGTEGVARILTDPRALPDLRALAKAPAGSRNAEVFTTRLIALANGGSSPARTPQAASAR